ncbi:HEXXH motif domain-containing protein [Nocardia sp. NPDC050710]|uniref:HEXXH motif domain-containing protein n=1 Tax=Nocardia sp. NPDC050710 TaxID=3157220 RepID=UPI0033D5C31B
MTVLLDESIDITTDLSSGHGSGAGASALMQGLLTLRMMLLHALVDEVADHPEVTAQAGVVDAYRALADVQAHHPEVVATLLCYPNTGTWLNHVLLRATAESDDSRVPLWADCGYLGWLAASASIMSGTAGSAQLVLRNGAVMLPGLGLARLGEDDVCGHCDLSWTTSGTLHFTAATGSVQVDSVAEETQSAWLPLHFLGGGDGEPLVRLDDLDPFRQRQAGLPMPRLDAEQARRWQQDFTAAWQLLHRDLDRYVAPMRECLRSITPLSVQARVETACYTSYNGPGCVYTTATIDTCEFALTLLHEIQHTKFNLLSDQVELFIPDTACRFYAPWRDDPRPIFGLLHGIYAFFGVVDFWRVHRTSNCHGSLQAHADFELWRTQLSVATVQAADSGLLTDAGHRLLRGLETAMRPWNDEQVPAEARYAAAESSAAHRTYWAVRNSVPDPEVIAELAARWDSGKRPVPILPSASLIDQAGIPARYKGLHLAAQLTTFDTAAAAALSSPEQPAGDHAYLTGDIAGAHVLYSEELRADPLRPQLWAGLALTAPKMFGENDFGVLAERAEIAAGLYAALGADTDILQLLRWLSAPS